MTGCRKNEGAIKNTRDYNLGRIWEMCSMQKDTRKGFKSQTLLQSNNATNCTTVQPLILNQLLEFGKSLCFGRKVPMSFISYFFQLSVDTTNYSGTCFPQELKYCAKVLGRSEKML
ncbi:hypothetical protein AMECASPLE_026933 [Ameca splendens]|uniref:Uncharacterized protein n=1 Tax=Ameca splendens TaxID=208324 RepID=A0ABV0ZEN5_9TELE